MQDVQDVETGASSDAYSDYEQGNYYPALKKQRGQNSEEGGIGEGM